MRYMVERNFVAVLGGIWMPYGAKAIMRYHLNTDDIENIGKFTRKNVNSCLVKRAGDFSSIIDFYATIGDKEIPWASKENGLVYQNTAYPLEY